MSQQKVKPQFSIKKNLLAPRFYTTSYNHLKKLNIKANIVEINSCIALLQTDYNKNWFFRTPEFTKNWSLLPKIKQTLFLEFFERSCKAEFSGFLLYKEIAKQLEILNPNLSKGFSFLARDEARHAGFLNRAINDFKSAKFLESETIRKQYTFFPLAFIFFATYLSERIGYWRYILIYRHLEKNKLSHIYPIFKYFEKWCQDENRHADFIGALIKSQKNWLTYTINIFWCKFFLITIFFTMYLNDLEQKLFYENLDLNAREFTEEVIIKTNKSIASVLPISLDLSTNQMFAIFEKSSKIYIKLNDLEKKATETFFEYLQKLYFYWKLGCNFCFLFFLPTIKTYY
jgi:magnesium-protoporphyrin IX monomethyl ester (oxidative) cyclase